MRLVGDVREEDRERETWRERRERMGKATFLTLSPGARASRVVEEKLEPQLETPDGEYA